MMKIYIAGPISGVPDYKARFAKMAMAVEGLGHIVLNPAVLPAELSRADAMPICYAMINTADALLFMEGWERSEGSQLEHSYAQYIGGKRIFYGQTG